MEKNFLVITSSDSKYGGFLINHWLKSLVDNVDTKLVDIVILDYGLAAKQKIKILNKGAKVMKCKRDGHVVNIRYRDMLHFLRRHHYQQVLTCDSGDIIFQKNIMKIFYKDTKKFRAVCEDIPPQAIEYTLLQKPFLPELEKKISKTLRNKKMINGGLVVAPYAKFKKLCSNMENLITNKNIFGPDQVILNYILYKEGFVSLDKTFNYVITTVDAHFSIKNGVFLDENEKVIPVVHNAGGHSILRPVKNFGYGSNYNKFNPFIYILLRTFYRMRFFSSILRFVRQKFL